ncbi:MAG: hypothetical protein OSB00_09760 [Sphingomonas bacterium]|nr:hypothetical protein [Sphingomonas bacterium]
MKGAAARAKMDARLFQRIALNAAYQTAALGRVKNMGEQMNRFERALDGVGARRSMIDRLREMQARGAPMRITKVAKEA